VEKAENADKKRIFSCFNVENPVENVDKIDVSGRKTLWKTVKNAKPIRKGQIFLF